MTRPNLYPIWPWAFWVLFVPLALVALGAGLAVATDVGDLPFDHADLWWLSAAVPVAGLVWLYGMVRRRRALYRFTSAELAPVR